VADLLRRSGLTLSLAESCSGGLLAKRITDLPGCSAYFLFGAVTYADSAKRGVLGVPAELLAQYGAVSSEVALAMAGAVRRVAASDLSLATTGIAGPDGGSREKPVGTVYVALAAPGGCQVQRFLFPGNREQVRALTVRAALEMLCDHLEQTAYIR
jgi:nicotinamide-nucleotide amidase